MKRSHRFLLVLALLLVVCGVAYATGTLQTFAGRVLVTAGVEEPLDSSGPGVAIFYDVANDRGGISAYHSGNSAKPLRLNGSIVEVANQLHAFNDAASATTAYAQLKLTPRTSGDTKTMALGVTDAENVTFIQGEEPGEQWLDLSLQPQGGNVGIGTKVPGSPLTVDGNAFVNGSVILTAPDGHCATVSLTNGNGLVVSTVTCPSI